MSTEPVLPAFRQALELVRSWRGRSHCEAGDRARDARQWDRAADEYAAYLRRHPADGGIWVQLGNCAKEAGRFDAALSAYEAALALLPTDPDIYLQKGHLLKITGLNDKAAIAYATSIALGGARNPAYVELLTLGGADILGRVAGRPHRRIEGGHVLYIDVTDLIDYLRVNLSFSGIQRVVSNLIAASAAARYEGWAIVPVLPNYAGSTIETVDLNLLCALIDVVSRRAASREAVDLAIGVISEARRPEQPQAGDAFLIAGAFWIFHNYDVLNAMRRAGVHVTVFIHDLIQVTNPEFVQPEATAVFRRSLADVLATSSALLTNSRFVAGEVRRYLDTRMNFAVPVTPVTLATELGSLHGNDTSLSSEVEELALRDYVLCVGTLEIRKNHLYVIRIWERLQREHDGTVPDLVIVGKWGWEIDDLLHYLKRSDHLGGRLHILDAISDANLDHLYRHCLFTVYASLAEGWGLPVGESLGYGKPCIASKVTAIPEVGGALCRYLDPFDPEDGYAVVSATLSDRADLGRWTEEVRRGFTVKTWAGFADELFRAVIADAERNAALPRENNCLLEESRPASFGDDALAALDTRGGSLVTARMTRVAGWEPPGASGCWMSRRRATLRFLTRLEEGAAIALFLLIAADNKDRYATCEVHCGGHESSFEDLSQVARWRTAGGRVGADGYVDLTIVAGRNFRQAGEAERYGCLVEIGYCRAGDAAARRRMVELIVPGGLPEDGPAA